MGVSIDYWTAAKVEPKLKQRLEIAAVKFVRSRRWWSESLGFFAWPGKEGHLAGSTKFSRSDAAGEDDLFMADVDLLAILEQLAAWSAEHGIDWEVQLAGEKWGTIRHGKLDAPLKTFCTQAKKTLGKATQATKRIEEIHREYDGEPATLPAPKNVKQLRDRWLAKQIRAINKFIAVEESASDLLNNKVIRKRSLPAGLVSMLADAEATWYDLRGFPLQRCNALVADRVDFSYCKAPRPKQRQLPGAAIIMTRCRFTDCRFVESGPFHSCGDEFVRCDFTGAKLRGTYLLGTIFRECNFTGADLGRIEVSPKNVFQHCLFERTRFVKAEPGILTFTDCIFRGCDWDGAYLPGVRFVGCDVRGENLSGTDCHATAFDARSQTKGLQL